MTFSYFLLKGGMWADQLVLDICLMTQSCLKSMPNDTICVLYVFMLNQKQRSQCAFQNKMTHHLVKNVAFCFKVVFKMLKRKQVIDYVQYS